MADGIDVVDKQAVYDGITFWLQLRALEYATSVHMVDAIDAINNLLDELVDCENINEFPWEVLVKDGRTLPEGMS